MGTEFGLVLCLCLLVWAVWLLGGRDVCVKGEAVGFFVFFFFNFQNIFWVLYVMRDSFIVDQ